MKSGSERKALQSHTANVMDTGKGEELDPSCVTLPRQALTNLCFSLAQETREYEVSI